MLEDNNNNDVKMTLKNTKELKLYKKRKEEPKIDILKLPGSI